MDKCQWRCDHCDLLMDDPEICCVPPTPTVAADAAAPIMPPHDDDAAVERFAAEMKAKLSAARAKGRSGWQQCAPEDLSRILREHVEKGDPRDVANFCMFLWSLEAPISKAAQPDERAAFDLPPLPAPLEIDWPELHSHALGCGVEDRNIRDRYEAAEYGWQDGADKAAERVPEEIFTADQMREYALAAVARATAPQATVKGDDLVPTPRELLGAACHAIDRKRDAPIVLAQLRKIAIHGAAAPQAGAALTDEQIISQFYIHTVMDDEPLFAFDRKSALELAHALLDAQAEK